MKEMKRLVAILLCICMLFGENASVFAKNENGVISTAVNIETAITPGNVSITEDSVSTAINIGDTISLEADPLMTTSDASEDMNLYNVTGELSYTYAYEVLDILNAERAAEGLPALTMDMDLLEAAMTRAAECAVYYDHTRPNGETCFSLSVKMYGENIAAGSVSPAAIMDAWMNSEGHRNNILKSSYQSVGIGVFKFQNCYYWTQCFGKGEARTGTQPADTTATKQVYSLLNTPIADMEYMTLEIGDTEEIPVSIYNNFLSVTVQDSFNWTSSNPAVATVSNTGLVTAAGAGTATITATNINCPTTVVSCTVTVNASAQGGSGDIIGSNTDELRERIKAKAKEALDNGLSEFDLSELEIIHMDYEQREQIGNALYELISEDWRYFYITRYYEYEYAYVTGYVTTVKFQYANAYKNADGTLNRAAVNAQYAEYEIAINSALNVIAPGMSDLEKALALHDYIVMECDYDYDNYLAGTVPESSYTIWGALIDGVAVCEGYTQAYGMLLNEVGIENIQVSSQQMHHTWNMVLIDDYWYHVDTTWDDPVFHDHVSNFDWNNDYADEGFVGHTYFMKSDEEFLAQEHYAWNSNGVTADWSGGFVTSCFTGCFKSMYYWNGIWYYQAENTPGLVLKSAINQMDYYEFFELKNGATYVHGLNGSLYYSTYTQIYRYDIASGKETLIFDITGDYPDYVISEFAIKKQQLVMVLYNSSTDDFERVVIPADLVTALKVQLNQEEATLIGVGETVQLTATIYPETVTNKNVTWTSSNPAVATVSDTGLVTSVGEGTTTITVTTEDSNRTATCDVTVKILRAVTGFRLAETTFSITNWDWDKKLTPIFTPVNATNQNITWTSSNPSVVTMNPDGSFRAVDNGTSIITATTEDGGFTSSCTVEATILPSGIMCLGGDKVFYDGGYVGMTSQVDVMVTPINAVNKNVTWSSSNPEVATVDETTGLITFYTSGITYITATTEVGGFSTTCEVEVRIPIVAEEIILNKTVLYFPQVGNTERLTATVLPENAEYKDVTWTSYNESVAIVDRNGQVTATGEGATTILAYTLGGNVWAECAVYVGELPPEPTPDPDPEPDPTPDPGPSVQEEQVRAFVERMYTIVLNREADPNGLDDWAAGLMEQRVDGAAVVNGFVNSAEFAARNLSNEDFIKTLYEAVLNRAADAFGISEWMRAFEQGATRQDLIDGFVTSAEFDSLCDSYGILAVMTQEDMVRNFASRMYTVALNRPADEAGLSYWVSKLMSGSADGAAIADGFINSPEFIARNLNNADYIKILYRTFLNREASDADVDSWMAAFEQGFGRPEILNAFIATDEFGALCESYGISAILTQRDRVTNFVARMYTVALNRGYDEAGLNDWVTGLIDGVIKGAEVAEGFIMSEEFMARGLSNAEYVRTLYRTFFNREASEYDVAGWVDAIVIYGQSYRDVLKGFVNSAEFEALCNEYRILRGEMR